MGEIWGFAVHVITGRWFSLYASFLVMSGAGATYLFGTYSKEIKATLGYDQQTLNLLGFFKDLGANVGVISGLIAQLTPTWFVLLTGSAMNFVGYFMIWLAVAGKISEPKVWQMCVYICIGANSQNFANTGWLVPCVVNFPQSRGVMLGLLKGFVGLSGAVMTQLYLVIYSDDSKSLILLIAWLPAAISVVFVYTIRVIESERRENELGVLFRFLYVWIALALFLMVVTILQKRFSFSHGAYAACATGVCVLLFVPLVIAFREEWIVWNKSKDVEAVKPAETENKGEKGTVSSHEETEKSCFDTIFDKPERGEDYTILQALFSIGMLLLFCASICGLGASLTAVDNLGQIGESLGYPTKTIRTFVSLVSIWNYFGRVFAGFVSETLITRYKTLRPLMMSLVLFLSAVGHIIIAFPFPGSVYLASVVTGFSFGAQLALLYAIISEIFGLKYYATLFNCGQYLDVKVTGMLYDKEASLPQLLIDSY